MSLYALARAVGVGTTAGLVTWGYNAAAKSGKLGDSTPYVDPAAGAGATVAVATIFAKILSKNPGVVLGAGGFTFIALCLRGDYNNTIREKAWNGYYRDHQLPSKEMLILELKRSDDLAKSRREIAERLLKDHYS